MSLLSHESSQCCGHCSDLLTDIVPTFAQCRYVVTLRETVTSGRCKHPKLICKRTSTTLRRPPRRPRGERWSDTAGSSPRTRKHNAVQSRTGEDLLPAADRPPVEGCARMPTWGRILKPDQWRTTR